MSGLSFRSKISVKSFQTRHLPLSFGSSEGSRLQRSRLRTQLADKLYFLLAMRCSLRPRPPVKTKQCYMVRKCRLTYHKQYSIFKICGRSTSIVALIDGLVGSRSTSSRGTRSGRTLFASQDQPACGSSRDSMMNPYAGNGRNIDRRD